MTDFSLFKTYDLGKPVQFNRPSDFVVEMQVWSEQWLDGLPQRLIDSGMTCQQARDYITANYAQILGRCFVKRDFVMDGFSAFVNPVLGAGSPPDYGNVFNRVAVPDDITPGADYSATTFVEGFPVMNGTPVDGTWNLLSVKTFAAFPSTNPGTLPTAYGAWLPDVLRITSIDINKWFCNVTQCCSAGIPANGAASFLIPQLEMPAPVEEKSSVPLIKSAVYLSNHSFQFIRNFGRLPK